jgi:copper(I)-binding protein
MFALKALMTAGAVAFALPASAEIRIIDPYIIVSSAMAHSAAAFFSIENTGTAEDHFASASANISAKVELHTHIEDANGVMQMVEVPQGWTIPAGGTHVLKRGSDHVMFLGLTAPIAHGDVVSVTLNFDRAGAIVVDIPVDLKRDLPAATGANMPMGNMPMSPAKP